MSARIDLSTRITDPVLAARLWRVYRESFRKAAVAAVQDQSCYTETTLAEALADEDYAKFVAYDAAGEAVGLGLVTNDMEKASVTYVNPRFLAATFPEEYAAKSLYYFTAIAVLPEHQGGGLFMGMMAAEMTAYIDARGGTVLFDHSLETSPTLPQMLRKAIRAAQEARGLRTLGTTFAPLGGQQYGVIRFTPKP